MAMTPSEARWLEAAVTEEAAIRHLSQRILDARLDTARQRLTSADMAAVAAEGGQLPSELAFLRNSFISGGLQVHEEIYEKELDGSEPHVIEVTMDNDELRALANLAFYDRAEALRLASSFSDALFAYDMELGDILMRNVEAGDATADEALAVLNLGGDDPNYEQYNELFFNQALTTLRMTAAILKALSARRQGNDS